MDSNGNVRKLKRNELPLFRGESPGYAFVFCTSMSPSLRAPIIHDGSSQNRAVARRDRRKLPSKMT